MCSFNLLQIFPLKLLCKPFWLREYFGNMCSQVHQREARKPSQGDTPLISMCGSMSPIAWLWFCIVWISSSCIILCRSRQSVALHWWCKICSRYMNFTWHKDFRLLTFCRLQVRILPTKRNMQLFDLWKKAHYELPFFYKSFLVERVKEIG